MSSLLMSRYPILREYHFHLILITELLHRLLFVFLNGHQNFREQQDGSRVVSPTSVYESV